MAKIVSTSIVDDLDGTPGAETVRFGLDGKSYTIDLSKKNANALRKALAPFLDVASVDRAARRGSSSSSRRDPAYLAEVRAWARKKGYEVAERGRVPAAILEEYDATGR
jgi:hypothetical protein